MKKVFLLLSFLLFLSLCACTGEKQKKHDSKVQTEKQNPEKTQEDNDEDLAEQMKEFIQKSAFVINTTCERNIVPEGVDKFKEKEYCFKPQNIRVIKEDTGFKTFATLTPENKYITIDETIEYEIELNYAYHGSTITHIDADIKGNQVRLHEKRISIPIKPAIKLDIAEIFKHIPDNKYDMITKFDRTKNQEIKPYTMKLTKDTISDVKIINIKLQSDIELHADIEFTVKYEDKLYTVKTYVAIGNKFEDSRYSKENRPPYDFLSNIVEIFDKDN